PSRSALWRNHLDGVSGRAPARVSRDRHGGDHRRSGLLQPCGQIPIAAPRYDRDACPAWISAQILGGVSGRSRGSTPHARSADAIALAIAPPTGMTPPSPAPLAPSGLLGEGNCSSEIARTTG